MHAVVDPWIRVIRVKKLIETHQLIVLGTWTSDREIEFLYE